MLETGVAAWPPPPFPPNPCLLPRSLANGRGEMCKRACETIAQASSPERCQRKSPRDSHKQPRENIDLLITSPLQRIAARRARASATRKDTWQITLSRAARAKIFHCLQGEFKHFRAKRGAKFFARSRRANERRQQRESKRKNASVPHPPARTAAKRKQPKKCERFPCPTAASEEKTSEKNASVSPSARTAAKRKQPKKCERFPRPTTASEEKRSEKTRAFPPAHERPQAQKHTRARAQSARA